MKLILEKVYFLPPLARVELVTLLFSCENLIPFDLSNYRVLGKVIFNDSSAEILSIINFSILDNLLSFS